MSGKGSSDEHSEPRIPRSLDAVDAGQHSERRIDQLTKEWPVSFGAFPTPIRRFEFRDGNIGLPFPGKQAAHGPEGDVARKEPLMTLLLPLFLGDGVRSGK